MGSKIVFEGEKEINYVCGELKLKDKIGLERYYTCDAKNYPLIYYINS